MNRIHLNTAKLDKGSSRLQANLLYVLPLFFLTTFKYYLET